MSHYGPPGGHYPGQPQEPWQGRGEPDPYGQSPPQSSGQKPWDDPPPQPPYGHSQPGYPPYAQPAHAEPGYDDDRGGYEATRAYEQTYAPAGSEPPWADPAPPAPVPDRRGGMPILVLAVVLALLVFGGGGTALYLLGRGEEPATAEASPQASTPAPSGAARPSGAAKASTPGPQASTDARFVKVGQCVKNEGAASQPRLVITKCGARTYQVLARIDGATTGERDAKAKCGKVRGYTDWFFFNSELDALDFVLCLKLR
jgi:hypothetical protein